ncbi:MAG: flagellar hook assembly protein FlgD [Sphingomonadaceae bacterium]
MSAIIDTPVATAINSTTSTASAKSKDSNDIGAEQDKFMKLLVTQLKNQDPFNPMDNAAMTSQLAQLSTVTGINKVNDTLNSLRSDQSSSQTLAATNLISKGVLVPGKAVSLSTTKPTDGSAGVSGAVFGIDLASPASSVKIEIKDKSGNVVRTIDAGASEIGSYPQVWDGKSDAGVQQTDGEYTFSVTATSAGKTLTDATALSLAAVNSVSTGSGGVKLNTTLGQYVMADVKQVM